MNNTNLFDSFLEKNQELCPKEKVLIKQFIKKNKEVKLFHISIFFFF